MKGIKFAQWSNFSNTCAAIGNNGHLYIVDECGAELELEKEWNSKVVTCLSWSRHSDAFLAGCRDGSILYYDLKSITTIETSLKSAIEKISWNRDGFTAVAQNHQIERFVNNKRVKTLTPECNINILIGDLVLSDDSEIMRTDRDNIEIITSVVSPVSHAIHDLESYVITYADNILMKFSLKEKMQKHALVKLENGKLNHIQLSGDCVLYSVDDTIYMRRDDLAKVESQVKVRDGDEISAFYFYQTKNILSAITKSGKIAVWRLLNNEFTRLKRFDAQTDVCSAVWSPFGEFVLVTTKDNAFSVCQIPMPQIAGSSLLIDSRTIVSNSNRIVQLPTYIKNIKQFLSGIVAASIDTMYILSDNYDIQAEIETKSEIFECFSDRIVSAEDSSIDVLDQKGNRICRMATSDGSTITGMSLCGRFCAVMTIKNSVDILDVSRRRPSLVKTIRATSHSEMSRVACFGISRNGEYISIRYELFSGDRWIGTKSANVISTATDKAIEIECSGKLIWDSECNNVFCAEQGNTVTVYGIDSTMQLLSLGKVSLPGDFSLQGMSIPRILQASFSNTYESSVSSHIIAGLTGVDGLSAGTKRLAIDILMYLKQHDQRKARDAISKIEDASIAKDMIIFLTSIKEHDLCHSLLEIVNRLDGKADLDSAGETCQFDDRLCKETRQYIAAIAGGLNKERTELRDDWEELMRVNLHMGNMSDLLNPQNPQSPKVCFFMGRFYEQKEQYDLAIHHYESGNHIDEVVRLLTVLKRHNEVKRWLQRSQDRAALCTYARLLGKIAEAKSDEALDATVIDLYIEAGEHGSAFEYAFKRKLSNNLVSLSLSAPKHMVAKAAAVLERSGDFRTAILFYLRGNRPIKALKLALENKEDDLIDLVADSMKPPLDVTVANDCARYYSEIGDVKHQTKFLCLAGNFAEAKNLCAAKEIKLPDDVMAFVESCKTVDAAELCEQQEHYTAAAIIYTTIRIPGKALQQLIALDDTTRVIKFTKRVNRIEIYDTAADYLASKLPAPNSDIFNYTIDFYTKCENTTGIISFMTRLAKHQILTYNNYYRAQDVLMHLKMLVTKMTRTTETEQAMSDLLTKVRFIEMYTEAVNSDAERKVSLCNALLTTRGAFSIVKYSDVQMLLVQDRLENEDYQGARRILEQMRAHKVDILEFFDKDTIRRIYIKTGKAFPDFAGDEVSDVEDDLVEPVEDDF